MSPDDDKKGIIFEKSKKEIDEALFIKYLYTQSKNQMKKYYDTQIAQCNEKIQAGQNVERQTDMIQRYQRSKEVNNTCMFYCIALYFTLKDNYAEIGSENLFDYFKFYRDSRNSTYKEDIIKYFSDTFLKSTVKIMSNLLNASGTGSATNWLKKAQSQKDFFDVLNSEMAVDTSYQEMYEDFIDKFAV